MAERPPETPPQRQLELAVRDVVRFVDGAPDGIVVVDVSGTIRYANTAAHHLLHRPEGTLLGEPFGIPLGDEAPHDIELRTPTGSLKTVEVRFTPVQSEGQEGWTVALRDVTRRAEANRALLEMIQQREDVIAVTSHELRNPLTVMTGVVEAFLDQSQELSSEERVQTWRRLERHTARMAKVVEQFLDAARLESGLFRPHPVPTVLLDVVLERLPELGDVASSVDVRIDPDITVLADPDHLWTILGNFAVNSSKYAGTQIVLAAEPRGEACVMTVSDTGPGVPDEHVPGLFDRYTQVRHEDEPRGSGLGLWIARSIAECYGGRVWFEPGQPVGSVFACQLPLAG